MQTWFSCGRDWGCLKVALVYAWQNIKGSIKVRLDFKKLEDKVPIVFSVTQGFPARRDGR